MIRQRYEVVSIVNDLLIGTWLLIGTIFFLLQFIGLLGTWLFLLGSIEMLIRPTIQFVWRVHLKRYHPDIPGSGDAAHDF